MCSKLSMFSCLSLLDRIDNNLLQILPPEFSKMHSVRRLWLHHNRFDCIPVYIPEKLCFLALDEQLFYKAVYQTRQQLKNNGPDPSRSLQDGSARGCSTTVASSTQRMTSGRALPTGKAGLSSRTTARSLRTGRSRLMEDSSEEEMGVRFGDYLQLDDECSSIVPSYGNIVGNAPQYHFLSNEGDSIHQDSTSASDNNLIAFDAKNSKDKWKRRQEEKKNGLWRLPCGLRSQNLLLIPPSSDDSRRNEVKDGKLHNPCC